ncbi:tRNA selenocysteine 1-associated protein 1 [Eumeta japonica]|uniref:tRNA selenocysteine 1-associated protein 1 n=1 Tax=Eumeta variegata TaxID=151549 RepID=A0A4C1XL24_EUMVA|nr:tRNA selenocysteine 1-associated protein 1 [Eumeta japonica]
MEKQEQWVPYELKPRDVEQHFLTCELLLQWQKRKGFLFRIMTGDEKWIYYDNPKRRKSWVILDTSGYTKGYGFVRFGNEEEQRNALFAMNGYTGLGTKPLKICTAVPKPKGNNPNNQQAANMTTSNASYNSGTEYNQYYDPSAYWQNYSAWSGYYGQEAAAIAQPTVESQTAPVAVPAPVPGPVVINDDLALVEHKKILDVDQMNKEFLDTDTSLWDSLEASQWFSNDTVEVH